ncbi:aminopeptidase [Geobacter sp. DSM 9736]|uniref:aminopeptidase n=1 Tax=Geobacter sp. DSM 9736 TaxID=1277350 RepID=UPI000B504E14|nr:aminopeptidase [Geobacter sp. DSM 9736]SNB48007.1 Leucyl aminopeptidase (aminopeptidase T) [Geobacter sp. DSM 9736]
MKSLEQALHSLFEVNMGIKPRERIVVFGDILRPDEQVSPEEHDRRLRLLTVAGQTSNFAEAAYGNTTFVTFPATAASGAEPPEPLWRATLGNAAVDALLQDALLYRLLNKEADTSDLDRAKKIVLSFKESVADIVIALSNNSTSHTRFRSLVNEAGGRFASLPHFDPEMFFTSMQVDWHILSDRTNRLAAEVNAGSEILLETPNGTRIRFGTQGRTAKGDDGLLTDPGSFGNLPAGEVYLAPLEGTSEGVMVIEYAPTRKLNSPLRLDVRQGNVVNIYGDDPYRHTLEKKFAENVNNRNIAELGIGTNDRATRPDNVLEAEKILGTVHIALGDNSGFGGTVNTPFHEDFVFYEPTLTVILPGEKRKRLLDRGKLLIS